MGVGIILKSAAIVLGGAAIGATYDKFTRVNLTKMSAYDLGENPIYQEFLKMPESNKKPWGKFVESHNQEQLIKATLAGAFMGFSCVALPISIEIIAKIASTVLESNR